MKYSVKFSCGHEATVQLFGPTKERNRKIEWFEEQGLCPACYAAAKEAEKAKGCAARTMPYREYKARWFWLKTAEGSYDTKEKTVTVYIPDEYEGLEEILAGIAANSPGEEGYRKNVHMIKDALDDGTITREQAKTLALVTMQIRYGR